MRISVIGIGHLAATHAACLAVVGHDVTGADRDPSQDIRGVAAAMRDGVWAVPA
jgi:UDP-glucose 6-dehydrogenase